MQLTFSVSATNSILTVKVEQYPDPSFAYTTATGSTTSTALHTSAFLGISEFIQECPKTMYGTRVHNLVHVFESHQVSFQCMTNIMRYVPVVIFRIYLVSHLM
jgi:hypothetical protein